MNNAADCLFSLPLTFNRDLRNMTDHKLIVEIEALSAGESIDLRNVLNVNAIDSKVYLEKDVEVVKRFEVPVVRLRQENKLDIFITSLGRKESQAVFKLRRIEFSLERIEE